MLLLGGLLREATGGRCDPGGRRQATDNTYIAQPLQLPTQIGGDANSHPRHHKKVNKVSVLPAVILRIGIVSCIPVIVIAVAIIPLIAYADPKITVQTEGDQALCRHSNVSAPRNCLAYRAGAGSGSSANCRAFSSACDRADDATYHRSAANVFTSSAIRADTLLLTATCLHAFVFGADRVALPVYVNRLQVEYHFIPG